MNLADAHTLLGNDRAWLVGAQRGDHLHIRCMAAHLPSRRCSVRRRHALHLLQEAQNNLVYLLARCAVGTRPHDGVAHLDFLGSQLQLQLGPGRMQLRQQLIGVHKLLLLLLRLQKAGRLRIKQRVLRAQERRVSWFLAITLTALEGHHAGEFSNVMPAAGRAREALMGPGPMRWTPGCLRRSAAGPNRLAGLACGQTLGTAPAQARRSSGCGVRGQLRAAGHGGCARPRWREAAAAWYWESPSWAVPAVTDASMCAPRCTTLHTERMHSGPQTIAVLGQHTAAAAPLDEGIGSSCTESARRSRSATACCAKAGVLPLRPQLDSSGRLEVTSCVVSLACGACLCLSWPSFSRRAIAILICSSSGM